MCKLKIRVKTLIALVALATLATGCSQAPSAVDAYPADMARAARGVTGLPQVGSVLGDQSAPGRANLYVDVSRTNAYLDLKLIPALLRSFVRPGRMALQLRTVTRATSLVAAPVSARRVARHVQAAGLQTRLWQFYYALRGKRADRSSGAVLLAALRRTPGVDAERALAEAETSRVGSILRRANRDFVAVGVPAEPCLVVTRAGRAPVIIELASFPSIFEVMRRVERALTAPPG